MKKLRGKLDWYKKRRSGKFKYLCNNDYLLIILMDEFVSLSSQINLDEVGSGFCNRN